jgi:hypothetical protein
MSGFNQNLQKEQDGPVILRDYLHAAKTFRTNSYENAPKLKFLFHTYFSINPTLYTTTSPDFGLLVKEIKLPQFGFTNLQLNQYNRKRIIQTKIKYEAIDIVFHDDNADRITKLWEAYYQYYYNDGTKPSPLLPGNAGNPSDYNNRNIYERDLSTDLNWGFSGGQTDALTGKKIPFFKNITVFGFNQHNFTAYTLVNPIINSFVHDTYNYSEGGGVMTNRMSIDYETVVYNYGNMDGRKPENIVTGFGAEAHYDRELSPISIKDSNGYVLGQGGLVPSDGGSFSSVGGLRGVITTNADVNTANEVTSPSNNNGVANAPLNAGLREATRDAPTNRNTPFNIPSAASSPSFVSIASAPTVGALSNPPIVNSQGSIIVNGTEYQKTTPAGAPLPPDPNIENQVNESVGEQYTGQNLIGPFGRGLATDTPFNPSNLE